MPVLLVSGPPGTGKSRFASWLADHRGYVAIETDRRPEWFAHLVVNDAAEAAATVDLLRSNGAKVVVEWGFLPKYLDSVGLLRDAGLDASWFTGDLAAARAGFIHRTGGTEIAMKLYAAQMSRLEAALPLIEQFYGDQVIQTVTEGPTYVSPEKVANLILQAHG